MPHRDDLEAAHRRIEALERELEDTRADADRSRERVAALERSAAKSSPAPPKTPSKKRRRKRGRASEAAAPVTDEGWPQRNAFRIAVSVLAACAYGGAAIALFIDVDLGTSSLSAMSAAVVAMALGTAVLGHVFRAPGPSGGAIITLLVSGATIAVGLGGATAVVGEVIPPGPLRVAARVVALLVGVAAGVAMAAAWVPDAAATPIEGD